MKADEEESDTDPKGERNETEEIAEKEKEMGMMEMSTCSLNSSPLNQTIPIPGHCKKKPLSELSPCMTFQQWKRMANYYP